MSSPILEARGLVKSYDDGRVAALRGVDVSIEAGEYLTISGPSGSREIHAAAYAGRPRFAEQR